MKLSAGHVWKKRERKPTPGAGVLKFVSSPIHTKCYQARKMANSTMVGTGFAMEGRNPSWVYNKAFSLFVLNIRDPQQLCNVRVAERDVLEAGEFEWLLREKTCLNFY